MRRSRGNVFDRFLPPGYCTIIRMPTRENPTEKLIETLRVLQAAGQAGFEGLILNLLTQLTGRPFRIAHSGSQDGRDMSTGSGGELVIVVECKRFGKKTEFDTSHLLGKIIEARKNRPDIWMLVTSRSVGDKTATSLREYSESQGIELVILDCTSEGSGYLPALCAAFPKITVASLARHAEPRRIHGWLSRIRKHPQHQVFIKDLGRVLRDSHIGYASTADTLLEQFLKALAEDEVSRARLGQRILPRARGNFDVQRAEFIACLDTWWHTWRNGRDILVVQGAEGTGKSWALASWLALRMPERHEVPVLIWLSAQFFEFPDLVTSAINFLKKELPIRPTGVHEKRFRAWTELASDFPRVVIIVDGLNERANRSRWQGWLVDARHSLSDLKGVALILTSRSIFWQEIAEEIPSIDSVSSNLDLTTGPEFTVKARQSETPRFHQVGLGDFNDIELEEAMRAVGLSRESVDPSLAVLIRRPRFFSIAARHWKRLNASGDFTRERLFLEEWRDRMSSRKQQELSDREFEAILIETARTLRGSTNSIISQAQLVGLLQSRPDWEDRLNDLISAGIFEIIPGAPGKYRASKERLYVGLGLLLLEEAVCCSSKDVDVAVEMVTSAMEPAGDADDVGAIMRHAACAALVSSGPHSAPREARIAVLLALARQRNGSDAWQQAAPWIYYPDNPDVLLEAAKLEWSRETHHSEARERFAFCLSHVADRWPSDAKLIQSVTNWLGYVYPDGPAAIGTGAQRESSEEESFSTGLAEAKVVIDSLDSQICLQVAEEQCTLGVSQLAFLVASHGPHKEYVNALTAWALGRSVMKFPLESDEARWLVRIANADTRKEISLKALRLAGLESHIARKAAALLFMVEGSRESLERADSLAPLKPLPAIYLWNTIEEAYSARSKNVPSERIAEKLSALALNPAIDFEQFAEWGFEAILDAIDTSAMGGRMRTQADHQFESAEQTLCRLAPRALSELFLRAVHEQLDRVQSNEPFYLLDEAFILFTPKDLRRIEEIRREFERNFARTTKDQGDAEANLAGIWLASLTTGEAQLAYLLSRRQAFDNEDWSSFLEPLSPATVHLLIEKLPSATGLERRRYLCFPWQQTFDLQESDRQKLQAAADDEEVGTVGVLVPQHAQDAELLLRFAEDKHYDDEILSRIFKKQEWARSVAPATSTQLGERLGLAARTWAIAENGLRESDIVEWGKEFDAEIRRPHGPRNLGSDGYYSPEVLSKALDVTPGILYPWIDSIITQDGCGFEIIDMRPGLLKGLVLELLNRNDRRGTKIIRKLTGPGSRTVTHVDRYSRVASHYFWPFEAKLTAATQEAIMSLLDLAINNDDIQQIAFAASYRGRGEALMKAAEEPADGGLAFLAARSLMIYGLSPYDSAKADQLGRIEQHESSWVRFAANYAQMELKRDGYAQHWFHSFLCSADRAEAWAAFRLFLRCVDRRWLIWQSRELQAACDQPDYQMRRRHLILNWKEIDRRVEKRVNEQKKRLFAWPLPGFDLLPWKRAWRL
jgi:hypothetical protein